MALSSLGKWIYGALFVVLLPIALAAWAMSTRDIVSLPAIHSPVFGWAAASIGALLLLLGMAHLWMYGGGLPMNAYPPPRYVTQGIFRLLPHPIYTGFSIVCAGISIAIDSASGLWLITPIVALGCAALVLGYERHDLRDRFSSIPSILLPEAGPSTPSGADRLACYLFVLLPWLVLREAESTVLPFEQRLPVLEWSEIFYAGTFVLAALAPLFAATRSDLRTFSVRGLAAMLVTFLLYLVVPLTALPSFQFIWALLAAEVFARRWPRLTWLFYGWPLLAAVGCVTTGQDPIVGALGGFVTVALVVRGSALWNAVRMLAQRIANSWQEWRIGPVRIINHGIYAGAGALVSVWIAGTMAGLGLETAILVAACTAVVGAALWAQYVEGSPQLLRPFGFYGGLLGGTLGALMGPLFGASPWLVLAAFSVGGPWAQALGRLRCLVQGCCHGRPAPAAVGICYVHPRSRVCRMTAWTGVPLHPTPVYSILWNALIALTVTRLWMLSAPLHLISGMYFILTGLGRFVEEAWRGEPQTPVFLRLRLYQWAAIASVIGGALMTALGHSAPAPAPRLAWDTLLLAAAFGLAVCIAMGVDFPDSNRRFSRLV
jgi:prolipoprotein diacylglyceryltransferase/protein-S-isoprenylcysteine O-methyltransferase Ste14